MSLATALSTNDQSVLLTILGGGEGAAIEHTTSRSDGKKRVEVDVEMAPDCHIADVTPLVAEEKRAIAAIDKDGDVTGAFEVFDKLIAAHPDYASAYNNRAQVRRIVSQSDHTSDIACSYSDILKDLEKCISLAELSSANGHVIRVSKMQATVLQNAYTQLGAVFLALADGENETSGSQWDYQEKASNALYSAGLYGSEIAKSLAAKVNPYAKLCGNMVEQALLREREMANESWSQGA